MFKYLVGLVVLAAEVAGISYVAEAGEPQCFPREIAISALIEGGGHLSEIFMTEGNIRLEMWKREDGSWALLVVEGRNMCLLTKGYANEVVEGERT